MAIELNEIEKEALKNCKKFLVKNDLIGTYRYLDRNYSANEINVGNMTAFLLENNIDIWRYLDIVPPFAFSYCDVLDKVEIPEGITQIGKGAFAYSKIQSVEIPDTVTNIGTSAFVGCDNLRSFHIPESVVDIGSDCFRDDDNIRLTTPRRKKNRLRLPTSEIEWYKKHLVFIDE